MSMTLPAGGSAGRWRPWAVAAGLVLIAAGLLRPADGERVQTAIHPVPAELLVRGERLFNAALIGHGVLLVGSALASGARSRRRTESEPLLALPPRPAGGRGEIGWVLAGVLGLA